MDTIFAQASARGKAGVAIMRLSGPLAHQTLSGFCKLPKPRYAALRNLKWQNEVLDTALVILFEAGHSFTGEESAEFHLHGSLAVVGAMTRILTSLPGLRMAEPGEFTRRALENGCLDLTQIEGLADLIDSETVSQRKQAMRVLSGAIGKKVDGWRRDLIRAAALIEATIDFADEDLPVDVMPEVKDLVAGLMQEFKRELNGVGAAERIREGFEVAIVGSPNIGKSTLLNALAGRDAAITSAIAGTTRDVIEVRLDLGGLAVTVLDTAGLRETYDIVEKIGIERAIARATAADLRVFLLSEPNEILLLEPKSHDIVVLGKADLRADLNFAVSGQTGLGLERLIENISRHLTSQASCAGIFTRERQRLALLSAAKNLETAERNLASRFLMLELIAADLRATSRALEVVVGKIDVENLLDEIFLSFCIGK